MCYNIGVLIIYKEGVNVAKKKTKREKKKGFAYSSELYGVIFLLAGIIGIGKYGPVGNLISSFAVFLVGVFYNILLVLLIILFSLATSNASLDISMPVISQLFNNLFKVIAIHPLPVPISSILILSLLKYFLI